MPEIKGDTTIPVDCEECMWYCGAGMMEELCMCRARQVANIVTNLCADQVVFQGSGDDV